MTKLSLVPEIAAYAGMSFINLIEWILKDASIKKVKKIKYFFLYFYYFFQLNK